MLETVGLYRRGEKTVMKGNGRQVETCSQKLVSHIYHCTMHGTVVLSKTTMLTNCLPVRLDILIYTNIHT